MNGTKLLIAFLAFMPASPAFAAATDWIDVAPGAQLRAISAGAMRDGKALIGLELSLQPGLNTYWRVPGESGVPASLLITAPSGAVAADIYWPLPERDVSQGFVDYVYRESLVLPVLVAAPIDAPLELSVQMGICSDICVPVLARLNLPGDAKPDVANGLRLRQALADTPVPYAGDDPPLSDIALDPQTGALSLAYDPIRIDPEKVFPSFDGNSAVYSAPEVDASAKRMTFMLLVRKGDVSWRQKPLRLSFATSDGPYDLLVPEVKR